nr:tafazzin [Hymenolepis microstoma]
MVNQKVLWDTVRNRPSYKPLITVSNHHSCLDDFILFGNALPFSILSDADRFRWVLTAVDICFLNTPYSIFFASGKGIPVWRRVRDPKSGKIVLPGLGVYQPSMDFSLQLLNSGFWIHSFSQGRVIMPHERDMETQVRLRWGIGRLLADAKVDPIILPVWHCGIDNLSPCKEPYVRNTIRGVFGPRLAVTAYAGEPFEVGHLVRNSKCTGPDLHARLTEIVQRELYKLKPLAEDEHAKNAVSVKY